MHAHTHTHIQTHTHRESEDPFALPHRGPFPHTSDLTVLCMQRGTTKNPYCQSCCFCPCSGVLNDAVGCCQSSGRVKLIWKLDLRIIVLNYINSDIKESRVRMKIHSLSSHRALCTMFPGHLITLSHLKLHQKLFNNSAFAWDVPKVCKGFSYLHPLPSFSLLWLTLTHCSRHRRNVPSSRQPSLILHMPTGLASLPLLSRMALLIHSTYSPAVSFALAFSTGLWALGEQTLLASSLCPSTCHMTRTYCMCMEYASCHLQRQTGNRELLVHGHFLVNLFWWFEWKKWGHQG